MIKKVSVKDKVGFTSYEWKGRPVSPMLIDREAYEASKMFCINTDHIKRRVVPPRKVKLWSEIKYRLSLAWAALRHGRDYFD